uniref:elongation of very long chain fatty acids protein 4 isoform X2 n=1 Tax=Ciona intestinalis TaxID=7719 RepID=UPI000180BA63|nr:elongation of very long chain fatty acids protein 4 isoform X2 [Ciona intestinalis]|eukprot:XP_002131075.1 elongation of very long chain fatty acids protein 4 isoform X2 [Ciona intestinalis]
MFDVEIDPRTKDWFLVDNPTYPVAIVLLYLVFCFSTESIMKDRPAVNLRWLFVTYYAVCVLLSIYISIEILIHGFPTLYNAFCPAITPAYQNSPSGMRVCSAVWVFYMTKYLKLFDTVPLMLQRKFDRINSYHIYHHCSMTLMIWFHVKYYVDGPDVLGILLNSLFHILVYGYYGMNAFGPSMRKYLWWKKYIIKMHMVEFWTIILTDMYYAIINCNNKGWVHLGVVIDVCLLTVMILAVGHPSSTADPKEKHD